MSSLRFRVLLAALATACAVLVAGPVYAQSAATLVSDYPDYAPGDIAILTGAGFEPFEVIDVSLSIDDPETGLHVADYDWTIEQADASGAFETYFEVPYEAADMVLTATAMGYSSALVATATFTDASPVHNVNFATSGLPSGVSITISWSKTNPAGNPASGSRTFTTPGPSADEGTKPSTTFTYSGFPASVTVSGQTYNLSSTSPASPFTTGAAGAGTTVTATYEKEEAPTCPTNSAPTISASDLDLGPIVGCLLDGSFETTVDVSAEDLNPVTDDSDGDPLDVTLDVGEVTLVGPGYAEVEVTLTATDDPSGRNVQGCPTLEPMSDSVMVKVTAQIVYNFVGFGSPLSNSVSTKVKRGSAVPVKFQLFDCAGIAVTTGTHTIAVYFNSESSPIGDPDLDSGASGDNGINFRYSAPNWIFNLKTNATYYSLNSTYKIVASLDDGTTHDVFISTKP